MRASRPGGSTTTRCFARCTRAHGERPWTEWPEPLRDASAGARSKPARLRTADDILFRQLPAVDRRRQWQARAQARARRRRSSATCRSWSSGDSADVWARQDEFRSTPRSACRPTPSAPPARTGACRSTAGTCFAQRDFDWLRDARPPQRRRSSTATASIISWASTAPTSGRATAAQPRVHARRRAGADRARRAVCSACSGAGRRDHRRRSRHRSRLRARVAGARSAIPGYRVFRWERHWHATGSRSAIPREYPALSVATSGTHDTEPMTVWWEEAPVAERRAVLAIPSIRRASERRRRERRRSRRRSCSSTVRATRCSRRSSRRASDLLILPIQECSAGAIASISRRRSATTTGPGGCRGRSIGARLKSRPQS